jgi:hypothetical protein
VETAEFRQARRYCARKAPRATHSSIEQCLEVIRTDWAIVHEHIPRISPYFADACRADGFRTNCPVEAVQATVHLKRRTKLSL